MVWRRRMWRPSALGVGGTMLLSLAAIQFAAIFVHGQVFSRYLVPVLVVLVPLVAALAATSGTNTTSRIDSGSKCIRFSLWLMK